MSDKKVKEKEENCEHTKHTEHTDKHQPIWCRIKDDIEIGSVIVIVHLSEMLFVFALLFIAIEGCVHVVQLFFFAT